MMYVHAYHVHPSSCTHCTYCTAYHCSVVRLQDMQSRLSQSHTAADHQSSLCHIESNCTYC